MRYGLRVFRGIASGLVLVVLVLGAVGYVVYAANGILDEAAARNTREKHDRLMAGTATEMANRLAAVAAKNGDDRLMTGAGAAVQATEEQALVQVSPSPTDTPEPSDTPAPSETPLPSSTPSATSVPATVTPIPTNTPRVTVTLIPTNTPRPSATPTASNTPLPSLTPTATDTLTPSMTPTPTLTFTPTIEPSPTYIIEGTYAAPIQTPIVPIPERAPLVEESDDIVNFLLLGSDTSGGGVGRTDVIILVSVNKVAGSVAMWHVPRDLIVYIPNHTMDRINLAFALGVSSGYPGGGFGLMKETILYNFGIEVDHYARVDFDDFQRIVKELGGLEVSVDCGIQDWRLKEPDLDPSLEESWEYYTLPIGRQKLDPYMVLWYVRSRMTTNDLDRGRRQMDTLRAMWYQAREQGLFTQVTQLWPEAVQVVETDMTLTDVLSFVPLAVSLDISNIARYSGEPGIHYVQFITPDDGRNVVLPVREKLLQLVQDFLTPPTSNRLGRGQIRVDVIDASLYNIGFDLVATDRLAWEGFAARRVQGPPAVARELTVIYDYTGQTKGSALEDLKRVLRVSDAQVISEPNPNRTVDFRVEIGRAYNSCVYGNAEDEIEAGPPIEESSATPVNVG